MHYCDEHLTHKFIHFFMASFLESCWKQGVIVHPSQTFSPYECRKIPISWTNSAHGSRNGRRELQKISRIHKQTRDHAENDEALVFPVCSADFSTGVKGGKLFSRVLLLLFYQSSSNSGRMSPNYLLLSLKDKTWWSFNRLSSFLNSRKSIWRHMRSSIPKRIFMASRAISLIPNLAALFSRNC